MKGVPRTIAELAKEYRRLAETCIDSLAEDQPLCNVQTALRCAELINTDIEEELRKLARRFPKTCISCRYSTPAYGTSAICDLTARFCELGKSIKSCDSYDPFPDL